MFSFLRVTLGTISQGTKRWHKLPNWQGEKQSASTAWVGQQQLCMLPRTASTSSPRDRGQHTMARVSQHNHRSEVATNCPCLLAELQRQKFKMRVNRVYSQRLVSRSRQTQHTLQPSLWHQLGPPTILFIRAAVAFPSSSTFLYKHHIYALHIWPANPSLRSSPCNPLRTLLPCKPACSDTATSSNRRQKPFHRHFPHPTQWLSPPTVQFLLRDHRGQFFPPCNLVKKVYYFWKQIRR